jgi:hydroxypyruvate reductase
VALSFAIKIADAPGIWALVADTDGIDGKSKAAGAVVSPTTLKRALAASINLGAQLREHNAGAAFEALGDALVTGPTMTNVNDFRAVLIV